MSDFKFEVAVEKLDKALPLPRELSEQVKDCLLYTSDAADE